jgi:hypothetical protein
LWLRENLPPEKGETGVLQPTMPVSVLQRPAGGAGKNLPALWKGDMIFIWYDCTRQDMVYYLTGPFSTGETHGKALTFRI